METQIIHKQINTNSIQSDAFYLNARGLYFDRFDFIPNMMDVKNIDAEKASKDFTKKYQGMIAQTITKTDVYKKIDFDETYIFINNKILLFFSDNYCEIFYPDEQTAFVNELAFDFKKFKQRKRRRPLEINLIVQSMRGLILSEMEIKRTNLDLDLFYNDDFKEIDATIKSRLKKKNDKGIILLHGMPGTGKTSYLRYLIGKINKKVLFLPPNIASCMMNPDFINLLINNPNSVIIIEDAENIIMERSHGSNSSVSNLLNISDGLLSDFLNVQLICTFNSSLTLVDKALLRKGRLISKYEFGKLNTEKAKRLSKHLGFNIEINEPMTIAEITNPHEQNAKEDTQQMIGFKRREEVLN